MNIEKILSWAVDHFGRAKFAPHVNELSVKSPFAEDPSTHLIINVKKRVYHCWISDQGGHLNRLLYTIHKQDWKAIARSVFEYGKLDLERLRSTEVPAGKLLELELAPVGQAQNWVNRRMERYLERRGFDLKKLRKTFPILRLENSENIDSPWFGRIIMPLVEDGQIVNYIGRGVLGTHPKYLFPKAEESLVVKSQLLFEALHPGADRIFVVEGIFDALKLWQLGFSAVATFGKASSITQASLISHKFKAPLFVFYDYNSEPLSLKLAKRLVEFGSHSVWVVPMTEPNLDPGDMVSARQVESYVAKSTEISSRKYLNSWILHKFGVSLLNE